MNARAVWLTLLAALIGFLIGVYVATGREASAVRGLLLCPPAILMALGPTDPRQSNIWKLVAPINGCLYGCLALTVRAFLKAPE